MLQNKPTRIELTNNDLVVYIILYSNQQLENKIIKKNPVVQQHLEHFQRNERIGIISQPNNNTN